MNSCPCGHFGDPSHECTCSLATVSRYPSDCTAMARPEAAPHPLPERSGGPGPLLDRIDIHLEVPRVEYDKLTADRLEQAVAAVIGEGRPSTWDLEKEGDARPPVGTKEMGEAIVEKIQSL